MSFTHFSDVNVPRSVLIKDDLLLSHDKISGINRSLKAHTMGGKKIDQVHTGLELDRVIHIYNQNVNYMNSECGNFKFFNQYFPTLAQYQDSHSTLTPAKALVKYEDLKTIEYHKYLNKWDEVRQLSQAGYLHQNLKVKIEKAIERFGALNFYPADVFPQLAIPSEPALDRAFDSGHGFDPRPTLRHPKFESKFRHLICPPTSTSSSSATTSSSVPSVPVENSKPVVEVSQPQLVSSVSTHVDCDVKNGVLGICHEPLWAEQPVLFAPDAMYSAASNESWWSGQIPVDKDFKFVIVENGKATQWEVGLNRRLTAENPSISLSAYQVKFPSI